MPIKLGGKAEQNKKAKKDALLNAAFELFTRQGINKTSIADISAAARVAKGTFYLYFADKYDLRNILIARKAGQIFRTAREHMEQSSFPGGNASVEDSLLFLSADIIDQFTADPSLMRFISKNLSWGIFKHDLSASADPDAVDFQAVFEDSFERSEVRYRDPEVMIFMIIELISSTSYSAILYEEPVGIGALKPYLLEAVRGIIRSHQLP